MRSIFGIILVIQPQIIFLLFFLQFLPFFFRFFFIPVIFWDDFCGWSVS
ncbi:MAG: hypothetical protein GYA80_02570 [Chloroflexi bacterium]|nr:hypothetical protein [Chloroflexota bacterium]